MMQSILNGPLPIVWCLFMLWVLPLAVQSSWGQDFDVSRALIPEGGEMTPPLQVERTQPLSALLKEGEVDQETHLLVVNYEAGQLALPTRAMAFHHIAQGTIDGHPWMATFCVVCNTGVGMIPVVDGTVHHFAGGGLYDGLSLLRDRETGSIWNHITGECLYGPLQGARLPTFNLLHMNVAQALAAYPNLPIALSEADLTPPSARRFVGFFDKSSPFAEQKSGRRVEDFPSMFRSTIAEEDTRLPTMEVGLGVWNGDVQRFYARATLVAHDRLLFDRLGTQQMVVYIDPISNTPAAMYTDAARGRWQGNVLHLDTGETIRDGVLYGPGGEREQARRPLQMYTRWYGFALTFPDCDIYPDHKPN